MPEPEASHRSFWDLWDGWYEWATGPRQSLDEEETKIPVLYVRERVGRDIMAAAGRDASQFKRDIEAGGQPRSQSLVDVVAKVQVGLAEGRVATTENLVGLVEGSDASLKDEWVIVSAHHDHNGVSEGRVLAGADDDGSGTVCVMEMARALVAAERRPRRSVLFASWGAEEKGLLGSRHYAAHPLAPLKRTAAVLQLDMIGRDEAPLNAEGRRRFAGRDSRNSVNLLGTAYSPELRALLGRLNAGIDLELDYKLDRDVEQMLFTRSDQWPFAQQGVPSLFFTTGLHPEYHTPSDTPEKIHYEKMEKIARLAYRALWAIADADRRPAFQPVPVSSPR
jgi:Zn-dependent M28 family amino/carboxypeptidase